VVAFGIAPSILGYIFVYRHFHLWATLALFIYLFASVLRLAKYNITPKEKAGIYFYGLPTTASGGVLASFILIYRKYTRLPPPLIFILIVLILAFLMVSKFKYLNLDGLNELFGKKIFFILALTAVAMIFLPEITLFTLFLLYLLFSPLLVKNLA
jgi:CDP-diacylglycerol--serine O-phosphatidyltransferase